MIENDVRGWCLGRDNTGAPTLSECAVMRGVEGKYFAQMNDRDGNPITVRTYQLGETFFESRVEALREMLKELNRTYVRYAAEVAMLDRKIHLVIDEIEEAGDAT